MNETKAATDTRRYTRIRKDSFAFIRVYPRSSVAASSSRLAFASLRLCGRTFRLLLGSLLLISLASCSPQQKQVGIPPAAQATIDVVTADIAAGQDEKIYKEAAEEWRRASTLDETREFFKTLRTKLGNVKTRVYHTARGEQAINGQSLNVQYQTSFERAEGMETFTLVERDGRWLLARYFVNSAALK